MRDLGDGVVFGDFCCIDDDVVLGKGVKIANYVELRQGTVIGDFCKIDSFVISSGLCTVGAETELRYGAIIARHCRIGRRVYVSPRVMFNNLDHKRREVGGAEVGDDVFIGTHAVIGAGIYIAAGTVIGANALVTKSIKKPGFYVGTPARRIA